MLCLGKAVEMQINGKHEVEVRIMKYIKKHKVVFLLLLTVFCLFLPMKTCRRNAVLLL